MTPLPWGNSADISAFVYSDAFVTNKRSCASSICQADNTAFSAFMTSAETKKYIAFSGDLPYGAPARHLLVATKRFYDLDDVKSDRLYSTVSSTLLKNPRPYPNSFTAQLQYDLLSGICPVLKQKSARWKCKAPEKPK